MQSFFKYITCYMGAFSIYKMLWELFLAGVGSSWVFPRTVWQTFLAWQNANVGRKRKRIWMAAPLCLFWTVWQVRNRVALEDVAPSAYRLKVTFLCTLRSWANLSSVNNTDYFVDFLVWLGYRCVRGFFCWDPFLYTSSVLFGSFFAIFWSIY